MCDVTISLRIHPSLLAPHRNVLNSEGREEMALFAGYIYVQHSDLICRIPLVPEVI